jgi:hypothetical protein
VRILVGSADVAWRILVGSADVAWRILVGYANVAGRILVGYANVAGRNIHSHSHNLRIAIDSRNRGYHNHTRGIRHSRKEVPLKIQAE